MIAIYDGPGAIWNGKLLGTKVYKKDLLEGALDGFQVLIMPGGRDCLYHEHLKGKPNQKIRSFVKKGGVYLGICAGAYYGAKEVEFDRGYPLEVCEKRELAFFDGKAIGPAFGKGTYFYDSEKGARITNIKLGKKITPVYYNGGCFFEGNFKNVDILGSYLDLQGAPAAIIACPLGKGAAILSGVHLEFTPFFQEFVLQLNGNGDGKSPVQRLRHYL